MKPQKAGIYCVKASRLQLTSMVCLIVVFFLAACGGHLNEFSKAQQHFNIAAEAENRQKFFIDDPEVSEDLATFGGISGNYALAHKYISDAVEKSGKGLKSDNLLGAALTIKALCEWRLGKYGDASITSKEALTELSKEPLPTRDLVIMTAMPGLIKADQAYYHTISSSSEKTYEDIKKLIVGETDFKEIPEGSDGVEIEIKGGAIKDLDEARKKVDEKHPVQPFLLMSELAAYRTLQVAIQKKKLMGEHGENERRAVRTCARQKLNKLVELKFIDKNSRIHEYWETVLGL